MKKIEAIIRPEKVSVVRRALAKVGHAGIMISELEGHGKQRGKTEQFRGEEYKIELLSKIKLEIVVDDTDVDRIVTAIVDSARTGEIGDGKIFIYNIENAIKIRTGEKGDAAL